MSLATVVSLAATTTILKSFEFQEVLPTIPSQLLQKYKASYPSIFHYYVNVTMERDYKVTYNYGECPQDGIWPKTKGQSYAKLPCPATEGYNYGSLQRFCAYDPLKNQTYWKPVKSHQCYPISAPSTFYFYNVTYKYSSRLSLLYGCDSTATQRAPLYVRTQRQLFHGMKQCYLYNTTKITKSLFHQRKTNQTVLTVAVYSVLPPESFFKLISSPSIPLRFTYSYYDYVGFHAPIKVSVTSSVRYNHRRGLIQNIKLKQYPSLYFHISSSNLNELSVLRRILKTTNPRALLSLFLILLCVFIFSCIYYLTYYY